MLSVLVTVSAMATCGGLPLVTVCKALYVCMSMCIDPSFFMLIYWSCFTGKHEYTYDAAMNIYSETHAGEEVAIYARGPMSHLFHATHEQNYIAHVLMYAACIGPNTDHCDKPRAFPDCGSTDDAISGHSLSYSFILFAALVAYIAKSFH